MSLTQTQVDKLLAPIKPRRVFHVRGQSHVAAFDVIAHLTRIFGFGGWEKEILSLDLVHERIVETPNSDPKKAPSVRCWVTYRCVMRLTIKDPDGTVIARFDDAATGSAQNMPTVGDAHDFAAKNAVSYAIKRCAKDLGDQFGLSLYNGGSTAALLGTTLVQPEVSSEKDPEEHAPEPVSLGNDERQETVEAPEEVAEDALASKDSLALLSAAAKGLTADQKAAFREFGRDWPHPRSKMTEAQVETALQWIEANA